MCALWCVCGSQRACGSPFSPPTTYVLGAELGSSGLAGAIFYLLSHLASLIKKSISTLEFSFLRVTTRKSLSFRAGGSIGHLCVVCLAFLSTMHDAKSNLINPHM